VEQQRVAVPFLQRGQIRGEPGALGLGRDDVDDPLVMRLAGQRVEPGTRVRAVLAGLGPPMRADEVGRDAEQPGRGVRT
jgi:hypothetical protein